MLNKIFPTLYSRTSKGQVQEWTIEVQDNKFRTKEGILNGTITVSNWTECEGKNVGKANETSGNEQALKEAEAKWVKKNKGKYHEDIDEIDEARFFKPMTAHKWVDYGHKFTFPASVSPKLDGIRSVASNNKLTSREGNEFVSCPHITKALKPFVNENIVVDGELYNHKFKHDFNKIVSLVKTSKPTQKDLDETNALVQFHVFDMIFLDQPNLTYAQRLKKLTELVIKINAGVPENQQKIVLVSTKTVKSIEDVEVALKEYIEDGYEGTMIRDVDAAYENKRSRKILKYKLFQDAEFLIVDIEEGVGGRAGMMGNIKLKSDEGVIFDASARGNQEFFKDLLDNKANYVNKKATLRYQNLTPDKNVPRFGVVVAIRDYE